MKYICQKIKCQLMNKFKYDQVEIIGFVLTIILFKEFWPIHSYNKQMLSNPPTKIQELITNLLIDEIYKEAIKLGIESYHIKQFKIQNLTPSQVFNLYHLLQFRFYTKSPNNYQPWYQNEFGIFIWLLVCYCYLEKRMITQLNQKDWQLFSQIFNHRNPQDFQFQALSILKKQTKFYRWTVEQIKNLTQIINIQQKKNRWNHIAKKLYFVSSKEQFRGAKQCREYWINHLDPTPLKKQWNITQDLQLIQAIKSIGKKWSQISKQLNRKRTQHMVKNRYISLVQNQLKILKQENQKIPNQNELIMYIEKILRMNLQNQQQIKFKMFKKQNQEIIRNQQEFQSAEVMHDIRNSWPFEHQPIQSQSTFDVETIYKPILLSKYNTNCSIQGQPSIQDNIDLNNSFCDQISNRSILDLILRQPNNSLQQSNY